MIEEVRSICNVKQMLILNLEVCKNREISLLCMDKLTRGKITLSKVKEIPIIIF